MNLGGKEPRAQLRPAAGLPADPFVHPGKGAFCDTAHGPACSCGNTSSIVAAGSTRTAQVSSSLGSGPLQAGVHLGGGDRSKALIEQQTQEKPRMDRIKSRFR